MSKGVKIFLVILLILVVAGVAVYLWGKKSFAKLSFSKPSLQGLNLNGLTLADIVAFALTGSKSHVTVNMAMDIKNDNNFDIQFSNVNVSLSYKGTVIAQTSGLLLSSQTVPANGSITVSDNVNVLLNSAGRQLLIDKIKGGNPTIDYTINLTVFGFTIQSITDSIQW